MSLFTLPVETFSELSLAKQLLTGVIWIGAAATFLMISTQGIIGQFPFVLLIVVGMLVGLIISWSVAVILSG